MGWGEKRVKELPPRFIEFPFFFYLPIYFIFEILPSVIQLLNDFLVLKELLPTLV